MAFVGIPVRQFLDAPAGMALAKALSSPASPSARCPENSTGRQLPSPAQAEDALLAAAEHECVVDLVPRALHLMRQPRDDAPIHFLRRERAQTKERAQIEEREEKKKR